MAEVFAYGVSGGVLGGVAGFTLGAYWMSGPSKPKGNDSTVWMFSMEEIFIGLVVITTTTIIGALGGSTLGFALGQAAYMSKQ